ncbi:unnamed protein product, partial [Mesorhabditis belari]|uniref:Uncharacterized protein n=1 Tax=Mesorhabditis belari TaxID=2138241 RepID=A0AAF3FF62_9BILA
MKVPSNKKIFKSFVWSGEDHSFGGSHCGRAVPPSGLNPSSRRVQRRNHQQWCQPSFPSSTHSFTTSNFISHSNSPLESPTVAPLIGSGGPWMAARGPRPSPFPSPTRPLQLLLHELCPLLSAHLQLDDSPDGGQIKRLLTNVIESSEQIIAELEQLATTDLSKFESEWASLTWPCLTVASLLRDNPGDRELSELEERVNVLVVSLVNVWRNPLAIDSNHPENIYLWQQFNTYLTSALQSIHSLYSRSDLHNALHEINTFRQNELAICLGSFKQLCLNYSKEVLTTVRECQVERVSLCHQIPADVVYRAETYYSKILYCMSIIAARLQGFRYWPFGGSDPIRPLIDSVSIVVEQLLAECLFCSEPTASPILVTNNLFPFRSGCLARGPVFSSFTVQIIGEETAQTIQEEIRNAVTGGRPPSSVLGGSKSFPSAALLAMKPTSGTKRNNSTANAEGGNTAHKKSDVNSKEAVQLGATFSDKHATWTASYPHLLCTTRQKDSALLDVRSNQIGKRSLFYFYIKGTMFSLREQPAHVYTLSLPFTIATRRNQDCQVQRMMSSYTATCFWLYGTCSLDGLVLKWTEADISWQNFKELYKAHFRSTAEVARDLSEADFHLLEQKMCCEECEPNERIFQQEPVMVSFKNVMCPHLRYESSDVSSKFSIWRGLLELLQFFQDAKTNTKALWDDNYLLGFLDCDRARALVTSHQPPVLCLYLSYAGGGAICFVMKRANGQVIHLEPLDLKKLQTKSLNEYVTDIAVAERINYLVNANGRLVSINEIAMKYRAGVEGRPGKEVSSNVTHPGSTQLMNPMSFTPVRIAVVTCDEELPREENKPENGNRIGLDLTSNVPFVTPMGNPNQLGNTPITPASYCSHVLSTTHLGSNQDFLLQLRQLMKIHGKEPEEVFSHLQYLTYSNGNSTMQETSNGAYNLGI